MFSELKRRDLLRLEVDKIWLKSKMEFSFQGLTPTMISRSPQIMSPTPCTRTLKETQQDAAGVIVQHSGTKYSDLGRVLHYISPARTRPCAPPCTWSRTERAEHLEPPPLQRLKKNMVHISSLEMDILYRTFCQATCSSRFSR